MPSPQPPLILVDNVFDRINLYPTAVIAAPTGSAAGRDVNYAADYRRERSYWQAINAAAGHYISSDLGAGNTSVIDTVWIDRGHNLWGKTVRIFSSDRDVNLAGVVYTLTTPPAVPAQGTVGGDPATGWCVTEEGALYTFVVHPAYQFHTLSFYPDVWQPIITGVIMGKRIQLLNYSSKRDEDAGGRTERTQESDAGYVASERTYAWRTCELSLDLIGAAEYDSTIRSLRATLFERNQPAVIVMNYGDKPERASLMQYVGKAWSSPMTRAHRKWTGTFREVGAVIR